ncbi:VOC family protein [Microbacterium sp. 179-B 1A2 NHS]|uniref:VOC family protein n=1 Tax=Microbacterium sp. 179-B 1A2 NHS TaxID=3142383 RepID=UPI00399F6F3C
MAHGDITHTEIPVSDFAKATEFYGALFGWSISESPGYEDYPMWRAPNGISGGALTERTPDLTQPRSIVEVDSIDAAIETARAHGGSVLMPKGPIDETSSWAVIVDPDGNQIGLFEGTG